MSLSTVALSFSSQAVFQVFLSWSSSSRSAAVSRGPPALTIQDYRGCQTEKQAAGLKAAATKAVSRSEGRSGWSGLRLGARAHAEAGWGVGGCSKMISPNRPVA